MGTVLRAGRISMIYDNGSLRYISNGRTELLRMIYPAVRDEKWLTILPLKEEEHIEKTDNSFIVRLKCLYHEGAINFRSEYIIEGKTDSTITFSMSGEALDTFLRNRIGICVLHPIEGHAGNTCVIEHPDGSVESSFFPEEISPRQIFRDIKAMKWMTEGINCRLKFSGDVFETEDQRNWTDASFKTYSTPLSLPFPVKVEKGDLISQKIEFSAEGIEDDIQQPSDEIHISLFPDMKFDLPQLGLSIPVSDKPCDKNSLKIIRALRPDHLRCDIRLYDKEWQIYAGQACLEASEIGTPLEMVLFFDNNYLIQINDFCRWYSTNNPPISTLLLFHRDTPSTPDKLASEVIRVLRDTDPQLKTAIGTNSNFAELNRNRPGDCGNDYLCYPVHPQEHASDYLTLIENLKAQEYTVQSAKIFAREKDILVSPVTLHRRLNANVSFMEEEEISDRPGSGYDERLRTMQGACWCAGSLKYLSEGEAASLTYFETKGKKGVKEGDTGLKVYPVYFVLRFFLSNKSLSGIRSVSSKPLDVESLVMSDDRQVKAMLINFTGSVQRVRMDCCTGMFRITSLNPSNCADASSNYRWTGSDCCSVVNSGSIFIAEPFSVNFIEGWIKH